MGEYTELEAHLLDIAMILHAEHGGGNNSTFTNTSSHRPERTRIPPSPPRSVLSRVRNNGGANLAVVYMINDLKENVTDITNFKEVEKVSPPRH